MDREQHSLFSEILDWMLAPLLLLWPLSVWLTWLVAQNVANSPYDRALGDAVSALSRQVSLEGVRAAGDLSREMIRLLHTDEDDYVYFQVLGSRGEYVSGDRDLPVPALDASPPGRVLYRDDQLRGEELRVAYEWVTLKPGAPPALVQVGETLAKRSHLAAEIVKAAILPQFAILPVAVVLVWLALARGLAPLDALQRRIRTRAPDDLSPIHESDAPEEVSPLVAAINDLLARQSKFMQTQRRFIADAAHQLKTPLAGLRTQAELAQRQLLAGQQDPELLKASFEQMARGSQRAARMVNQLLAMARAEARTLEARRESVDLHTLATDVVRDFVPRALDKRIDLGYEGPGSEFASGLQPAGETRTLGLPVLMRELITNLVDNALQYTPRGGTITVRVIPDPFGEVVVLQVEDSGPGIPPAERELVFEPFYRALGTAVDGSGLGLAIVAEVARQHGATVVLEDARARMPGDAPGEGVGARFTIRFPALRPATQGTATGPDAPAEPGGAAASADGVDRGPETRPVAAPAVGRG